MQHVSKLLLPLLLLAGCAGIPRGLDRVQQGLAQVDMATDDAAEAFLAAVTVAQQACDQTKDPAACMDKLGLTEEVLDKVCVLGIGGDSCVDGAAHDLGEAYRAGAVAAAQAAEAWAELEPHLETAKAAAEAVKDGVAE